MKLSYLAVIFVFSFAGMLFSQSPTQRTLVKEELIQGTTFKKGTIVYLDKDRYLQKAVLAEDQALCDRFLGTNFPFIFPKGSVIVFNEPVNMFGEPNSLTNFPEKITVSRKMSIYGVPIAADTEISVSGAKWEINGVVSYSVMGITLTLPEDAKILGETIPKNTYIQILGETNIQVSEGLEWVNLPHDIFNEARNGRTNFIIYYIKNGGNLNARTSDGNTALMLAAWYDKEDVARLLIDAKADVNATNNYESTALYWAAQNNHDNMVRMLKKAGAVMDIYAAAALGETNFIISYIKNGGDAGKKNKEGWTLLMEAAQDGQKDVMKLLIDAKADVNARDSDGYTALMYASEYGNVEAVKRLINAKAEINASGKDGRTALMNAAANTNNSGAVKLLIAAGSDVNAKDTNSWTAILFAVDRGLTDTVKLLIDAKADVNAKNSDDNTALDIASHSENDDLIELLIKAGAKKGKYLK